MERKRSTLFRTYAVSDQHLTKHLDIRYEFIYTKCARQSIHLILIIIDIWKTLNFEYNNEYTFRSGFV